jgi:hypothetical protein
MPCWLNPEVRNAYLGGGEVSESRRHRSSCGRSKLRRCCDPAHRRAVLMLLATAILWSLGGLLIKGVDWNPVAIAGMRSLIGAAVIALIFRKELRFTGRSSRSVWRWLMPAPWCYSWSPIS